MYKPGVLGRDKGTPQREPQPTTAEKRNTIGIK